MKNARGDVLCSCQRAAVCSIIAVSLSTVSGVFCTLAPVNHCARVRLLPRLRSATRIFAAATILATVAAAGGEENMGVAALAK